MNWINKQWNISLDQLFGKSVFFRLESINPQTRFPFTINTYTVFLWKFCVAIFSGWRQQLQNKQDFLFFNPYLKLHNFIFQSRVFHFHRQDLSVIPPILKSSNFEILELQMRKKYFIEIKEVSHLFYIFYWALKVH